MKTPEVPALRTLKIQNTRSLSGASESGAFTGSRQVTTATLGVGHSSGSWSSKRAKLPNEPFSQPGCQAPPAIKRDPCARERG